MTRSVYVTGIERGDGRQVVELGIMELLTRQTGRVGVYRPLLHDGPDRLFDLLKARYRIDQDAATAYGMEYEEASAILAEKGTDELVSRLVDRYHRVARDYEVMLVLGTDYADTNLPDELALNARLANELGAVVVPVVGGTKHLAEAVRAEARNAHRAYESLGCHVVAMVVNRVAAEDRDVIAERLAARLPVPCYVLPDDKSLSAPTVAQITRALGGEVLLGDEAGLARDALDFVFGGAMLPNFLNALTPGCLVVTPGDRSDLVVGALAAHLRDPADRGRAADPERAPDRRGPDPGLEAGTGHPGGVGGRQQLPDGRRTLLAAEPVELRDPAQAGDGPRSLRTARGHRRTARAAVRGPVRAGHPDDVRARAAGAGPVRAASRRPARGHRGARAARGRRGAAPRGLRPDPARRGAGDPEEGRRPGPRHLGRAADRPGDLPCGNGSPSTTPRPAPTRA